MRRDQFVPEFVEVVPNEIVEGVLYVSFRFATVSHRCASGCGELVVTPIRRTGWRLTWDGETVTLEPSIGNWSLACRSHYWIRENRVLWASDWDDEMIRSSRRRRKRDIVAHHRTLEEGAPSRLRTRGR